MKKTSSTLLTLVLVVAIIVVVNYIVGGLRFGNQRIDLTENRIYTLSDGTKKIIKGLNPDQPVNIRLYVTRDTRLIPQAVQNYAKNVEDLLLEFEKNSDGKIALERIDPRPGTEEEDRAIADDVRGHQVNLEGDKAYFGLVVQSLAQKEVVDPGDETTLEYQVARALAKVTSTKRAVVGVMSPMPVAAPQFNFPAMMQQQQQQPWLFVNQLRLDYDVREIKASGDPIDSDVNVLLVLHPSDISPKAEFAIDQFLLRGGKVIALVDPQCLIAERYNSQGQMGRAPSSFTGPTSDLPNLFKAWGINYNKNMVVADMNLRMSMQGRPQPTFLNVGGDFLNRDEVITASLDRVDVFSAGAFEVVKKDGITATSLVQSSENSEPIDSMDAEQARNEGLKNFMSGGKRLNLAVRLTGKFSTAFPEGEPKEADPAANAPKLPGETGGAQEDAGVPKSAEAEAEAAAPAPAPAAETKPAAETAKQESPAPAAEPAPAPVPVKEAASAPVAAQPATPPTPTPAANEPAKEAVPAEAAAKPEEVKPSHLTESQNGEGVVFLVSDADFLYEGFFLSPDRSGRMMNGNLPLVLNMVEMLSGGSELIAVRSRASTSRPFTRIEELRAQVESEFRPLIEQSNKKLNDIVQKIADLGGIKEDKGMVVLNINQEQREQLLEEQANVQKELRNLQKQQNSRKDRLEMTITLLNLLAVPALVVAFGVILAVRRSTSQAAR